MGIKKNKRTDSLAAHFYFRAGRLPMDIDPMALLFTEAEKMRKYFSEDGEVSDCSLYR